MLKRGAFTPTASSPPSRGGAIGDGYNSGRRGWHDAEARGSRQVAVGLSVTTQQGRMEHSATATAVAVAIKHE